MASIRNQTTRSLLRRNFFSSIRSNKRYEKVTSFIKRKPFTSFLASLAILFLLILLGAILGSLGKKEEKPVQLVKSIKTYTIGTSPAVDLQAQIESNGVVQIMAQAPGVVSKIPLHEGDTVEKGTTIVNLSSNYQGGNAPALQAQLAGAQYHNTKETYSLQKDLLSQQRNIATASAENTEQLRRISESSLNDTRGVLSTNQDLLSGLNTQIDQLRQSNPTDQTSLQQLATWQGQAAQLQAGVAQLQSTVRTLEYQTNTINPPEVLASSQKEIALKQLDIQEKALDLGKEVSRIQYNLALVQEGTMHPSSPFKGTVERISVHVGQLVNPGQVIATISSDEMSTTAVVRAPREVAQSVSRIDPSIFHIDGKDIEVIPTYVSSVATDSQLYSIVYDLPVASSLSLTDSQYVPVSLPIGYADTNSVIPFIPIDAIYESQNESSVFVVENGKAVARKIEVGQVYGDYIEVKSGLRNGDQVILDRTIVAGDKVKVTK